MQLHQISSKNRRLRKKRIGRGGKRGTYSGKGQKGQKARAGHKIRPAQHDLIMRTPKLRGFKNKPKKKVVTAILNISDFARIEEKKINPEFLMGKKIISRGTRIIKVLGTGNVVDAKEFSGILFSRAARKKIEDKGGVIR